MENNVKKISGDCSFAGVQPVIMDLPYPPIQVRERNPNYAELISIDYCGMVSEMSAITQYINNENRMFCLRCPLSRNILGIAMAEMMHLQKLGELIHLLGGNVCFTTRQSNSRPWTWSADCLTLYEDFGKMLQEDIECEKAAINQYNMHIRMIRDDYVNDVLRRIIKDEEYHIMILRSLLDTL